MLAFCRPPSIFILGSGGAAGSRKELEDLDFGYAAHISGLAIALGWLLRKGLTVARNGFMIALTLRVEPAQEAARGRSRGKRRRRSS